MPTSTHRHPAETVIQTEVLKASAIRDLSLRILEAREPGTIKKYKQALAKYERGLKAGGHKEISIQEQHSFGRTTRKTGFYVVRENGMAEWVDRPRKPTPAAYVRSGYFRSGDYVSRAKTLGLVADSLYNREIRPERVDQYAAEMEAGRWCDLLSDPISITADGQILNGQHRIAAASQVDWTKVDNDPAFLVIWGVEPSEAQYADGSRRTARDERLIVNKLLDAERAA